MPLFVGALIGALVQAAGTLVGKVLLSLGIGYVVFTGLDTSLTWVRGTFFSTLTGLPAITLGVAGLLKIGTAANIIISALSARLVLNGLTGGALKRMMVR